MPQYQTSTQYPYHLQHPPAGYHVPHSTTPNLLLAPGAALIPGQPQQVGATHGKTKPGGAAQRESRIAGVAQGEGRRGAAPAENWTTRASQGEGWEGPPQVGHWMRATQGEQLPQPYRAGEGAQDKHWAAPPQGQCWTRAGETWRGATQAENWTRAATQSEQLLQSYRDVPIGGDIMGEAAYPPENQVWLRGGGGHGRGGMPAEGESIGRGGYVGSGYRTINRGMIGGESQNVALRSTPLSRQCPHHQHHQHHTNHTPQGPLGSLKSPPHLVTDPKYRRGYSDTGGVMMMNGGSLIPGETLETATTTPGAAVIPNGTLSMDHGGQASSVSSLCQVGIPRHDSSKPPPGSNKKPSHWRKFLQRAFSFSSKHGRSLRRWRLCCSACGGERRLCRHLCACCRRVPRRIFRGLQWCYGFNQRQTICWGLCDLYSIILSIIAVLLIARDQMSTHCIGVRYTSEYICSERYVSYECNFPERDFMEDEELFSRCGVHGNGQFKPHHNDSIETICGPNKPLIGSLKIKKHNTEDNSNNNYKVPNIVHYTVDCNESKRFDYINYLSFVSVERFLAPDRIYVHCNCFLNTTWWFHTLEEVMNIYVVQREFPEYIQARKPRWVQHRTDVIKLQTLFHNGGFHLDLDVLIVRPMTTLRIHDLVVGEQDDQGQLGHEVILSKPHDPLVCLWMNGFREYDPWPWQRQQYMTYNLQRIVESFPGKVQVLKHTLLKPGPLEVKDKLYQGSYDWKRNYAVKLWRDYVGFPLPNSEAEANALSSNLGELLRFVGNRTKPTSAPTTTVKTKQLKNKRPKKQPKKKKEPKKKNAKEK